MEKFNTTNTTNGVCKVTRCTPVSIEGRPSLLAFANAEYDGTVYLSDIAIREKKDGDVYLSFPNRVRKDKDGNEVKGEDGYPIRDPYYGPLNKETYASLLKAVCDLAQSQMDDPKSPNNKDGLYVHLLKEPKNGLVGFASGTFTGKFFLTNISVMQPEGRDAFISFPSRVRKDRDGKEVLDKDGKPQYDSYFGAPKADREVIQAAVFEELQKRMQ